MYKILIPLVVIGFIALGSFWLFSRLNLSQNFSVEKSGNVITNQDFNVLIVGWDGVQWDRFKSCFDKKIAECPDGLPAVSEVSGTGKRVFFNVVSNGSTGTVAGWPQIFTGYNAGYTGILETRIYKALPKGATIFEKIQKKLGKDKIATIFVGSGGKVSSACAGESRPTIRKSDPAIEIEGGGPYCYTKQSFDEFFDGSKVNKDTGEKMLEFLDKYKDKRFIMFGHFLSPDDEGHDFGGDSEDYIKGLKDSDSWLGKIIDRLKTDGIYQKTYIYLVSDHGWDFEPFNTKPEAIGATDHVNAPFTFFATNDTSVIRAGDRKDIAPTILKKFDVSLGEDKELNLEAIHGLPLDEPVPYKTIPKGGVYIKYDGTPSCTDNTQLIGFDQFNQRRNSCVSAQGGRDITAGFCASCGDSVCEPPENKCNCAIDCK